MQACYAHAIKENMTGTILSASFSYADIALLALLVLGLVLGLIRGAAKSFKGFFLAIAIILISLLLVGFTLPKVRALSMFDKLDAKIASSASGWGDAFNSPLYKEDDGSFYIEVQQDGEMQHVPLKNVDGFKGWIANFLAEKFVQEEGHSLGEVASNWITNIVAAVAAFIVFAIALGLICWLIRLLLKPLHNSESSAVKLIDRILGAIVSAALTLLFVLVAFAIFHIFDSKMAIVTDYLKNSAICGFLYESNPISTVFSRIFG